MELALPRIGWTYPSTGHENIWTIFGMAIIVSLYGLPGLNVFRDLFVNL